MNKIAVFLFAITTLFANIEKQKEFYQKHGFVWIKGFYSEEDVRFLQAWADELHQAALDGSDLIVVPEAGNPKQICRVEDLITCYPAETTRLLDPVSMYLLHLCEEPYVPFKDKLNFKWPGEGAFAAHQDFPAFEPFGPQIHLTIMVCIDPATKENGCLYVDNSWEENTQVLPYITGGENHGSIDPEITRLIDWLPVEAEAGDLVVFTSFLPHYSESNHSSAPRRALFFTYNRAIEGNHRETYYQTKRNDPQNPLFHFATPTKARSK